MTPPPQLSEGAAKSRYDIARDCVHCGLCLPVCPTYLHLGTEADSPRGRIYLMRAHDEGRQPLTPAFQEHLDLCLACRACETACPSGVRFGSMLGEFRTELRGPAGRRAWRRLHAGRMLGHFVLVHVLPHPRRLRALADLLWAAQASGALALVRRTPLRIASGLRTRAALAPTVPPPGARHDWPAVLPALGRRRARVLFLRGCVAPELLPEVQAACIAALRHNGCEVVTPRQQTCCGALHFHLGWRDEGLRLVRQNVQAFDLRDVDALVVNAAGCGSTLKEYGDLARDTPEVAGPARALAAQVRDVSEFLDALGLVPPPYAVRARVAYDEPCHLLHGQRVSAAPQRVLAAIPGLERVALAGADRCCGSAGIYNLLHPELAHAILQEKIASIAASGADTVATGNAGCILQIRQGLRRAGAATPHLAGVRVVHPMQLLAQAYTGTTPDAGSTRAQA